MTSRPKHQHPFAILAFLYRWFVAAILPFTVVFAVSIRKFWIVFLIFAGLTALGLISSLLKYWLFSYQMLTDEIVVKEGLFVKKIKHVPYDRIQNVETNQWFFLKPFHVESVAIETAGHADGPEISLVAVPTSFKKDLNTYRAQVVAVAAPITASASATQPIPTTTQAPVGSDQARYQISTRDLLKFAFTSPAFLSGLLAILAIYGKMGNVAQQEIFEVLFKSVAGLGIFILIGLILLVLLIFYIGSALLLIFKFYKFELIRQDQQFRLSSGLFKKKVITIKMDRIQAVVVKQPLLRRFLGIVTVKLIIISNSKQGETEKDVIMMPVLNRRQVPEFMARFLPTVPIQEVTPITITPRTYFYKLRNALLVFLPVALIGGFFLRRWLILDLSLFVVLAILWFIPAYLSAKRGGTLVLDDQYTYVQNNQFFTLNQYFIPKNKIQALIKKQSVWLLKRHFASLELQCRSGIGLRRIKVNYLKQAPVDAVKVWYQVHKKRQA